MKDKRTSKAQRSSSNIISTLPQSIIENILCLLPIEEAARTSILSREWRYKWTTIPKIEFGWSTVSKITVKKQPSEIASAERNMDPMSKLFNAIHQVLLMRQGPIHEFTFSSFHNRSCFELDQIIFHLSRNHAVKKLTLKFGNVCKYKLPLCAFSLHQLTDLHLNCIDIDHSHKPIFSGFGSLKRLCLMDVDISTNALHHLLSNCPSLERFSLLSDVHTCHKACTIVELFECLPVIKHLTIHAGCIYPWLVLDLAPGELPTSLLHLKYFCFKEMSFNDKHQLTFLALLIKCSPNLEKLVLEDSYCGFEENEICCGIWKEYSDVWLEHMKELEIGFTTSWKHEMKFVKFILARSPKLKKVWIYSEVEKDEESEMLKVLLQASRASQVEIVVK